MKLSVVVPAYNEALRLPPSLDQILGYLHGTGMDFEVLVVDDGSSDDTVRAAQARAASDPRLRVLSYSPNRGKGYAVRYGLERAAGDLVLFSDADLSTPIDEVSKMIPLIEAGCDVVIGSRALAHSQIRERQPLYRELAGKFFNLLVRLTVLPALHDTQCGFKLFRREAVRPVLPLLRNDGFAFDVEILALAQAIGLKIAEVPVVWINSPMSRVRLSAAGKAYLDLFDIRRRARRLARDGIPGAPKP